jgi:hypothetical protein
MAHSRKFVAMLACCVAGSAVLVGHASAGQTFQESYHDEGTLIHQNFCGVAGLTVSDEFVIDGKVRAVPHGPDGLDYFLDKRKERSVITNLANSETVTFVIIVVQKDLKVTDNGDGTLTIIGLGTGNVVVYGADGKALARNPGQSRFEILIDHGGTPNDPSDDEFISERRVKGSTGRTDDICAAVVPALT